MLRRKLIAYPIASLVALAGVPYGYHAAHRAVARAANATHFAAAGFRHTPPALPVPEVTTVVVQAAPDHGGANAVAASMAAARSGEARPRCAGDGAAATWRRVQVLVRHTAHSA